MIKDKGTHIPGYHSVKELLKGQASRIYKEVNEEDKIVIVYKQNKPPTVVIPIMDI
ncbi:hypothetical protein [Heliophilum fasciatum]|uniref:Uncharacterized protein n=1 Tax=Heliophilum fasciatum TaxID=35700 RepID=A0A4R2R9H6_9FIRM|nr:hypothetical protein [Heliophilum fasciatum]MCW2279449.1 hypothetical protein [Heliophilum fasciatum]TCP59880.1 hypothetical protein EDD73_1462 [Heliophilum fasciatum]